MVVFVAEHMLYRRPALSVFNTMGTVAGMRRVLSLSSSFYHPDIDMKGFELLSQASACLVPTGDPHLPQKFHILASAHVTHPWRFPNYYPHETHAFVHVLSEEHIRCSVGLRNVRGVSTLTLPRQTTVYIPLLHVHTRGPQCADSLLIRACSRLQATGALEFSVNTVARMFTHPTRDLSILHFADEDAFFGAVAAARANFQPCVLAARGAAQQDVRRVVCVKHCVLTMSFHGLCLLSVLKICGS